MSARATRCTGSAAATGTGDRSSTSTEAQALGATLGQRRFFDPALYRAAVDTARSGRSRPLASEPDADLSANTTAHLVADIERLRESTESRSGQPSSWGTTLGLAYAQAHPRRVDALVLGP